MQCRRMSIMCDSKNGKLKWFVSVTKCDLKNVPEELRDSVKRNGVVITCFDQLVAFYESDYPHKLAFRKLKRRKEELINKQIKKLENKLYPLQDLQLPDNYKEEDDGNKELY